MAKYSVTTKPIVKNYGEEIDKQINYFQGKIFEKNFKDYKTLEKLIKKYPDVPIFYNYLIVTLYKNKKIELAENFIFEVVEKHPNYLFGKFNLCELYLKKNNPEKVIEIFPDLDDISVANPECVEFHISEVLNFHQVGFLYYLHINEIEKAEEKMQIIKDLTNKLDFDFVNLKVLEEQLLIKKMQKGLDFFKKIEKERIIIPDLGYNKKIQTKIPPKFHHKEIELLYKNDEYIDHEIIKNILSLPKETLVEDLEKGLEDAIKRYEFFSKIKQQYITFPFHILLLLTELNSKKSLPKIFDFLSQGFDFYYFYFNDIQNKYIVKLLVRLLDKESYPFYISVFKKENLHNQPKYIIADAIIYSDKKNKFTEEEYYSMIKKDILEFLIENRENPKILDNELNSYIIWALTEINSKVFLPEIEKMYNNNMVNTSICGNFESVKNDILLKNRDYKEFIKFKDIYTEYDNILSDYEEDYEEDYDEDYDEDEYFDNEPKLSEIGKSIENIYNNVGRNDPCPCGSGKKYKKCCLNK